MRRRRVVVDATPAASLDTSLSLACAIASSVSGALRQEVAGVERLRIVVRRGVDAAVLDEKRHRILHVGVGDVEGPQSLRLFGPVERIVSSKPSWRVSFLPPLGLILRMASAAPDGSFSAASIAFVAADM